MPYQRLGDLPASVRAHLPKPAQQIYRRAFNHAWQQYARAEARRGGATREETAHKVAWAAVKRGFTKDPRSGRWKRAQGGSARGVDD